MTGDADPYGQRPLSRAEVEASISVDDHFLNLLGPRLYSSSFIDDDTWRAEVGRWHLATASLAAKPPRRTRRWRGRMPCRFWVLPLSTAVTMGLLALVVWWSQS